MFQTILVPVDFSVGTATQVRVARDLARSSSGSLILLHVREPVLDPDVFAPLPDDEGSDFHLMLEAMKLDLTRDGFRVESRCVKGTPAHEILNMASEEEADLIVMGTHGRTGLKHVLMGSVAERVVRGASCPVLSLKLAERPEHSLGKRSSSSESK